jgi:hypothetical protein
VSVVAGSALAGRSTHTIELVAQEAARVTAVVLTRPVLAP